MQYILEEANLTDTTDEPKPQPDIAETPTSQEPEVVQPETKEQEQTALVPTEPEVVDGEVVELEPQTEPFNTQEAPKQKPYWLLIPFAFVLCVFYLAVSLLLPLLIPSATVLIIPTEQHISTTTTIQVHGRQLPALTLSQNQTAPATGKRHQDATQAHGTITFYNGQLAEVTIAAGTVLTGDDGVQVITDQLAVIPAANLPSVGQVTVRAHALDTGRQGNIQAYDINQACCVTAVKAVNTTAFTDGAEARDYLVVTKSDISSAAETIIGSLDKSERAALNAQVITGESLTPPLCSEKIIADRKIGDEAREVRVSVSETCTSIAYSAHDVYQNATQIETLDALKRLGTGYSLVGNMEVSITHATITTQERGIATLTVKLDATYAYKLSPGEKQQLVNLIAGKSKQQAQTLLSKEPGIAGAVITIKGNAATLPENPGNITILVVQRV